MMTTAFILMTTAWIISTTAAIFWCRQARRWESRWRRVIIDWDASDREAKVLTYGLELEIRKAGLR